MEEYGFDRGEREREQQQQQCNSVRNVVVLEWII